MSLVDFVALSLLPIRRWSAIAADLRQGQTPHDILEAQLITLSPVESAGAPLGAASIRRRAAETIERGQRLGLDVVDAADPDYPVPLAAIIDPPPVLWLRGRRESLNGASVAIVGSRAGSPYALAVAERLAADLAARGLVVVSGLARGVDSAAHRGALAVAGRTVAVLGCGADIVYPAEHSGLAGEIVDRGAVISEFAAGDSAASLVLSAAQPDHQRVVPRTVVVVEAGEKSGSLITARCALEQGRDVLAVPGNILNGRNRGGHGLLRDGAKIVETADDIVEELGLTPTIEPNRTGVDRDSTGGGRGRQADPILAAISVGEVCDLDEIAARTGLSAARLLPRLFELELLGLIRRVGGGRFVRFDRSC